MSVNLLDVSLEYAKDKELKRDDVKALLEWAHKQPHLPKINELQAILFLQSCYYRNEMAKTTIDNYFTVKSLCPDVFGLRNPLTTPVKDHLGVIIFTALPKKTPEGYTIFFMKFMDTNVNKFVVAEQIRCLDMVFLSHLYQHGTSNGHLMVVDMTGLSFGHMTRLSPLALKKFFYYLQEAMPIRLKGLHFFNIVPFMDKFLTLIKTFMKKDLMSKLYTHVTVDDLVKTIPRDCLPQNYGGGADELTVLLEEMKTLMCENAALFRWEESQKVDESQRQGMPEDVNSIFGTEGTFKKLEID